MVRKLNGVKYKGMVLATSLGPGDFRRIPYDWITSEYNKRGTVEEWFKEALAEQAERNAVHAWKLRTAKVSSTHLSSVSAVPVPTGSKQSYPGQRLNDGRGGIYNPALYTPNPSSSNSSSSQLHSNNTAPPLIAIPTQPKPIGGAKGRIIESLQSGFRQSTPSARIGQHINLKPEQKPDVKPRLKRELTANPPGKPAPKRQKLDSVSADSKAPAAEQRGTPKSGEIAQKEGMMRSGPSERKKGESQKSPRTDLQERAWEQTTPPPSVSTSFPHLAANLPKLLLQTESPKSPSDGWENKRPHFQMVTGPFSPPQPEA